VSVGVAGTPMIAWSNQLSADERWDVISYINALRVPPEHLAEGQGLYAQRCAGCHGVTGGSDGALNAALSRLPAELASFAWQAERSDAQIAAVIRTGVPNAAMPAERDLTEGDLARVVAYVRTLSLTDTPAASATPGQAEAQRRVIALLDEALAAARAGRHDDAGDRAFDSYIAFEPMETPARARDPGMVLALERQFANFRGAIGANDLRGAERARNAIEEGLKRLVASTRRSTGPWGTFFDSFLIILREGFEAILVIGAIVALLIKTGHRERLRSIWLGVLAALGASALLAVVLATTLRAIPASREIIEGVTMLVAVAVLFSVSYWLISKVEAARWQQFIREKVTAALEHGGGKALAFVAFLAVFREGAETALLYQAFFHEDAANGLGITLGIVVGGVALVIIYTLFHRFGVRIPLRPFFTVTSALLYYLAFVFMGKGIAELQEGNAIPLTVLPGWPTIERLGVYPTVETLLGQALLVALLLIALLKSFWPRRAVTLPTVPPAAPPIPPSTNLQPLFERLDRLERRLDAAEDSLSDVARNDETLRR
jgi:high-affinity iron transporter